MLSRTKYLAPQALNTYSLKLSKNEIVAGFWYEWAFNQKKYLVKSMRKWNRLLLAQRITKCIIWKNCRSQPMQNFWADPLFQHFYCKEDISAVWPAINGSLSPRRYDRTLITSREITSKLSQRKVTLGNRAHQTFGNLRPLQLRFFLRYDSRNFDRLLLLKLYLAMTLFLVLLLISFLLLFQLVFYLLLLLTLLLLQLLLLFF